MADFTPVLMVHPRIPNVEEWADTRATTAEATRALTPAAGRAASASADMVTV